jgi:hypothetical protein
LAVAGFVAGGRIALAGIEDDHKNEHGGGAQFAPAYLKALAGR